MKPKTLMLIAGEASGDLLAAELVCQLRHEFLAAPLVSSPDLQPTSASLEPRFIGAGGPRMASAGVNLAFDMTAHSVIGLSEVIKQLLKFRRLFETLFRLALREQPEAIICVDFSGFNRRFAHAIKQHVRKRAGWFASWNPKLIQYVSPQVWASREGRARQMARDYDLLLSIFPFEKNWYARRVPGFRVEFVGHPLLDRYADLRPATSAGAATASEPPQILLLPGSRKSELQRHLPVMLGGLAIMRQSIPTLRACMVLPQDTLVQEARQIGLPADLSVQVGGLPRAMTQSTLALASTGTVTMECAYFGLPTVALYKTSWSTYQIGKRIVTVKCLAMPNLLANEQVFPEFIQHEATAGRIAAAALEIIRDEQKLAWIRRKLADIVTSLGTPGATRRAAHAVAALLDQP